MTRLTRDQKHNQQHAASLTHEQESEIREEARRTVIKWLLIPFAMLIGSVGFDFWEQAKSNQHLRELAEQQLETSHQIERDTVRSELSDIDHRIKQEECLIRPFGQVIRRDPTVPSREVAELCDPDQALPDLRARRDRLEERLREMGAYEERQ